MVSNEELNRMRWAARRGMLELDLVLEPFVARCYPQLEPGDRARFQNLMRCEDQQLYAWLLQRERPQEPEISAIVDRILLFTRSAPAPR